MQVISTRNIFVFPMWKSIRKEMDLSMALSKMKSEQNKNSNFIIFKIKNVIFFVTYVGPPKYLF